MSVGFEETYTVYPTGKVKFKHKEYRPGKESCKKEACVSKDAVSKLLKDLQSCIHNERKCKEIVDDCGGYLRIDFSKGHYEQADRGVFSYKTSVGRIVNDFFALIPEIRESSSMIWV